MGAELSLKPGEAVVFTGYSPYMGDSLTLYGRTYRTVPPGEAQLWDTGSSFGSYGTFYVILADMEEMKKLVLMDMQLNGAAERGIQYEYAFDLDVYKRQPEFCMIPIKTAAASRVADVSSASLA